MYLIIGASGFIGRHLYDYCKKNNIDVLGTYYTHLHNSEWVKFNICKDNLRDLCNRKMKGKIPNAVILCSANTNIDSCKKNEDSSNGLNVIGIRRIIQQANGLGIKCVFLSSETVFDGNKGMYVEDDVPNPISLYGKQKLQVEQFIQSNVSDYLIFRISRAVGSAYGEKDIFNEFYNKVVRKEEIVCLKDQSFCLTEIGDIVRGIIKSLEQDIKGLYHLSSNNYVSRYELAQFYTKKIFGGYGKIIEKKYSDMNFFDNRHILGGLNGKKIAELLGVHFMSIDDILNVYKQTYEMSLHKMD